MQELELDSRGTPRLSRACRRIGLRAIKKLALDVRHRRAGEARRVCYLNYGEPDQEMQGRHLGKSSRSSLDVEDSCCFVPKQRKNGLLGIKGRRYQPPSLAKLGKTPLAQFLIWKTPRPKVYIMAGMNKTNQTSPILSQPPRHPNTTPSGPDAGNRWLRAP